MRLISLLSLFYFLLLVPSWAVEQRNVLGLVESSLSNINNPFRIKCGQDIEEKVSCPYMASQFKHDSEVGLFFWMLSDSPWEICKSTVPSIGHISTSELEHSFSLTKGRDLGLKKNYFSNMFNKCFDKKYKSKKQIEDQKKVAVSMSYNYLNKIGDNTQALSKEIIQINSALGNDLVNGLPCDKFTLPENAYLCEKINIDKCDAKKDLSEMSKHLFEDAIAPIVAIAIKIDDVKSKYSGRSGSIFREKKLKVLRSGIEFIKAENPLLKGNKVSEYINRILKGKVLDPSVRDFKRVVKDQLISNKRLIINKINTNVKMNNCIIYGDSGNCSDFDKEFRKIPFQSTPYAFNRDPSVMYPISKRKELAREELYQVPECLDRSRNLKNDFNSFAVNTSLNIGLTIFTGGASLAVRAGQLGRIAIATKATALGADSLYLYNSIDESIKVCNESLNKLDLIENNTTSSLCPRKIEENMNYMRKRDVKSCITSSLLGTLDAIPFLPAFGSKLGRVVDNPLIPKVNFNVTKAEELILKSKSFSKCLRKNTSKECATFSSENSNTILGMHKKCLDLKSIKSNKNMCVEIESFIKNNSIYRLSDMLPLSKRGKSVVVELNSGRGHVTLRYFKEVEESGEKVMKAFSFDGSSWLLPRRVNGRTFSNNKKADSFESLDEFTPGAHYVLDITPKQLETVHEVAKKGGISKACTHDARVALNKAGILSMPKGISNTFNKITIKQLAKDLTSQYGKPKQNTIKALEGGLENSKVGFSKEQWRTFEVTEFGWLVLTPVVVGGVYPSGAIVGGASTVVIVDKLGESIAMTTEKLKELISELQNK